MKRLPILYSVRGGLVWVASWLLWAAAVDAADRTAAEILPSSTVAVIEISQPRHVVDVILEHPLRDKVLSLDQVRAALEKQDFLNLKAAVAVIESQMGMPWPAIVRQLAGDSITIGFDGATRSAGAVIQTADDTTAARLLEKLVALARLDATNNGRPDPVQTREYRGATAYRINKARLAILGRQVLLTNDDTLGKALLDAALDGRSDSLATNEQYRTARAAASPGLAAWAYLDLGVLRTVGAAQPIMKGPVDNPAAELLVGGIFSTLKHTPFVTAELKLEPKHVELAFAAPHDRSWAGDSREYFFGPEGVGAALPIVPVQNQVAALRAYRDVAGMWLRAGDLFNEKINDDMAKAESNLSTLFGGKDFGEDILGAVSPHVQLTVARQTFLADGPAPAIKLPAFGFLFELRDAERMQPELRRTFQSLIGFLNIVGAMNGQPQLELDMQREGEMQLVSATYLVTPENRQATNLPIQYNFSPSAAFAGNKFALASTIGLAKELISAQAAPPPPNATDPVINTELTLVAGGVRQILDDNREQLIAQNMLQEGHTREEAEQAVAALLEIAGWFDRLRLNLETTAAQMRLSLELAVTGG